MMKNKAVDNTVKIISVLKKMETSLRSEIRKGNKSLRQEILKVEIRVEDLEEGQQEIKKTLDNVQGTLDGFVGRVDDLTTENIVGANQFRDHEKRISKLESRSQSA